MLQWIRTPRPIHFVAACFKGLIGCCSSGYWLKDKSKDLNKESLIEFMGDDINK